ncbi:MAG: rod shape-determining protein MreC [Clostridia bacterium]|nr:rod shape-determining protein MreC [Clostridia bacterium]
MNKRTQITLFALTVITILLVVSIVVSASPNGDFNALYRIAGTPVTLITNGFRKAATGISDWFSYVTSYNSVKAELEELREKNAEIPVLEDEKERLILETNELRRMLDFDDYSSDYNLLPAQIVAEDVTDWFNTFTVDRGVNDGVKRGATVIAPEGLVGIVTEEGLGSSKILTIVDEDNAFMCRVSRTNELVRVRGVSNEKMVYELRVDRLSSTTSVQVGDNIVTAESGGVFPQGVMVGTVKSVSIDRESGITTALVEPAVDLTLLSKVFIMIDR